MSKRRSTRNSSAARTRRKMQRYQRTAQRQTTEVIQQVDETIETEFALLWLVTHPEVAPELTERTGEALSRVIEGSPGLDIDSQFMQLAQLQRLVLIRMYFERWSALPPDERLCDEECGPVGHGISQDELIELYDIDGHVARMIRENIDHAVRAGRKALTSADTIPAEWVA